MFLLKFDLVSGARMVWTDSGKRRPSTQGARWRATVTHLPTGRVWVFPSKAAARRFWRAAGESGVAVLPLDAPAAA
jgi:hypothetical protein